MTRDRLALLVTSSALLLSWLTTPASPTPDPAPSSDPPVARSAVSPPRDRALDLVFDVERESGRLRQRMAAAPVPRRSGRDPFRFAGMPPREPAIPRLATPPPEFSPPPRTPVAPVVGVPLQLIGMAARVTAEGVLRQAVLSGPGDVFIVSERAELLGRFTVTVVTEESVELLDSTTGETTQLRLRP